MSIEISDRHPNGNKVYMVKGRIACGNTVLEANSNRIIGFVNDLEYFIRMKVSTVWDDVYLVDIVTEDLLKCLKTYLPVVHGEKRFVNIEFRPRSYRNSNGYIRCEISGNDENKLPIIYVFERSEGDIKGYLKGKLIHI